MSPILPLLQAATPAAGGDTTTALIANLLPLVLILVIFYFLLIRPQQQRMKQHKAMIEALRRGDTVVTSGGIIGKVTRVADGEAEVTVEIAPNVNIKVVRHTISEVRSKSDPVPANDAKK
jgi:preprotein translocase subunit YajC